MSSVEEWVESIRPIVSAFYPTAAMKAIRLPKEEILTALGRLVEQGTIKLMHEVICPDCGVTLDRLSSDDADIASRRRLGPYECMYCGDEDIEVHVSELLPIYIFPGSETKA